MNDFAKRLLACGGAAAYVANAVAFNGSTHLRKTTALSGAADGKQLTICTWLKPSSLARQGVFCLDSGLGLYFSTGGSNRLEITDGGFNISAFTSFSAGSWKSVLFSVDLTSTTKRHLYINDVAVSVTWDAYTNGVMDMTDASSVGAEASSNKYSGSIADLWVDNSYLDFSLTANRRKFISEALKPVDLGASGNVPTGTSPLVFMSGATASWHTNKGRGAGYTLSGSLSTDTSGPS